MITTIYNFLFLFLIMSKKYVHNLNLQNCNYIFYEFLYISRYVSCTLTPIVSYIFLGLLYHHIGYILYLCIIYLLICFRGAFRDDIVIWAQKKTSTPVIRIGSVTEAEKFLRKYQTFLIGRFDKFEVS